MNLIYVPSTNLLRIENLRPLVTIYIYIYIYIYVTYGIFMVVFLYARAYRRVRVRSLTRGIGRRAQLLTSSRRNIMRERHEEH